MAVLAGLASVTLGLFVMLGPGHQDLELLTGEQVMPICSRLLSLDFLTRLAAVVAASSNASLCLTEKQMVLGFHCQCSQNSFCSKNQPLAFGTIPRVARRFFFGQTFLSSSLLLSGILSTFSPLFVVDGSLCLFGELLWLCQSCHCRKCAGQKVVLLLVAALFFAVNAVIAAPPPSFHFPLLPPRFPHKFCWMRTRSCFFPTISKLKLCVA